jgi:transcriptional regulator with XRE-family HTH domain
MESERQLIIRLIELMNVLGVNQQTIARRLGVTKGLVTQWKTGFRPIAQHQLEGLTQLMQEAFDEDMRREDDATPHLKTPREFERWRHHKIARREAFKAYQLSAYRWFEEVQPGSSLENLHIKAEDLARKIQAYLPRQRSLQTNERVKLSNALRELYDVERLITLLEASSWFESVDPGDLI